MQQPNKWAVILASCKWKLTTLISIHLKHGSLYDVIQHECLQIASLLFFFTVVFYLIPDDGFLLSWMLNKIMYSIFVAILFAGRNLKFCKNKKMKGRHLIWIAILRRKWHKKARTYQIYLLSTEIPHVFRHISRVEFSDVINLSSRKFRYTWLALYTPS